MINPFTGGLEFRRLKKNENVEEGFSDINADFCPMQSNLSVEEKIKLVKEVGEEIIQEDELKGLFESNPMPICYDGFEPSGRMHIAQGLLRAINVNRLTKAGCVFVFWINGRRHRKNSHRWKIFRRNLESCWYGFTKCQILMVQ